MMPPREQRIVVCHSVRGRLRARISALRSRKDAAEWMEAWLARQPGVQRVRARTTTGSVILFYDAGKTAPGEIIVLLSGGLEAFQGSAPPARIHAGPPLRRGGPSSPAGTGRRFSSLPLWWLIGLSGFFLYSLVRRVAGIPLPERPISLLGAGSMIGAVPLFRRAASDLREKKNTTLFPFLAGACVVAVLAGEAFTALEVIWVTAVSLSVEDYVADRSRRAIRESLMAAIKNTFVLSDGEEVEVPVSAVKKGQVVVVRAAERIPVDGVVVQGEALVDEAHITGRSVPEIRSRQQKVFAGTTVEQGLLHIRAEEVGEEIYLNRILRLVEESLSRRSPAERKADALAGRLTWFGAVSTAGVLLLTRDLSRVLSVMLVAACPCATVLAASTAVTAAVANSARNRVLIKGGLYLERMASADCFCFDKTGTLTLRSPRVIEIAARGPRQNPAGVLALAASAEAHTTHPVGRALLEEASRRGIKPRPSAVSESVLGKGIRATVGQDAVSVGNLAWMEESGVNVDYFRQKAMDWAARGETVVLVSKNGKAQGMIGISNSIRPETEATLQGLRSDGVKRLCLITGDLEPVARMLAADLRFDTFGASLLPEEKARVVKELQQAGREVVVVGDGVNDALALSQADIGVAMGAGGAEAAIEAADIALVDSDLIRLVRLRQLSRETMHIIEQNHWMAVSTNILGVFLGAAGRLAPLWGGLLHVIHSLGIMLNSSRLLRWEPPDGPAENVTQRQPDRNVEVI